MDNRPDTLMPVLSIILLGPGCWLGRSELDATLDRYDLFEDLILAEDLFEGDLLITEVMLNPTACDDSVSEWMEIINTSERIRRLNYQFL